jgi:hypothetical protein
MEFVMHTAVALVPFIALAVVGVALLWQHRTIVTALIALGFCSVALSHITGTLVGFYAFGGRGDFVTAMNRFGWTLPVTHWGIVVGLWVGSLSLLWHTFLQVLARTSLAMN